MSRTKQLALASCCALLLRGCAKDKPAAPARRRPGRTSRPVTRRPSNRPAAQPTTAPSSRPATAGTQPATAPGRARRFDEELQRIADLEARGEFTRAWKLAIEMRTAFAGDPRLESLNRLMGRLRTAKRQAAQLAHAIRLLGSDTVEASQIAASTLTDAGRIGIILLRKAVRTGPKKAAAKAVGLLVKLTDAEAATAFYERLKGEPPGPLRSALLEGLRDLAEHIPPAAIGELYASVKDEPFAKHVDAFGILAAAHERAAGGDPNAFAKLTGDPKAAELLKAKVSKALTSEDEAEARAASRMVVSLGLIRKGLRASYYSGENFEKLLFERLDSRILIESGRSPYPDGRSDQISVRWTGQVRIPAPGRYTFYAASDDCVRLWVAGKQIVNDWRARSIAESTASIDLAAGLHPIRMEFFQGGGDFGAYLKWSGPGIEKQLLTDKHLFTPPWPETQPREEPNKP